MKLVYESLTWNFRGEEYDYIHTAYKCEDTGEQFTTCESDDAGFLQVTNQYRVKYVRSVENGYSPTSLSRLKAIMLTVLHECGEVFCTKMNKFLFYIDFLSYRQRGMAMTSLAYRAIDFGPVPDRWDRVYSEFDEIHQETRPIGDYEGNVLIADSLPDENVLSEIEKAIISTVCHRFKDSTSREISAISHEEPAWLKYHESRDRIPYIESFGLKAF